MKIPVLLLVVISGCCANENLHGASFVFYKIGRTAKVVLKPTTTGPLSNITVCLQSYTDILQRDSLFKLKNENNSIALFQLYRQSDYYFISLDQQYVSYKISTESMEWRLICVTWESSTGIIHFVVNGKLFPRKVLKPGFIIDPEVTAVLGQDLAYAGLTSYLGEIRNVNMWDQALHPSEMQLMYSKSSYNCCGNVINWEFVDYEIDDVLLYKPSKKC